MSRSVAAILVATAVIFLVLLQGFGVLDPPSRTSRFLTGGCDVPEDNVDQVVSLTTQSAVPSGSYDSLDSPEGTTYTVPQNRELVICSALTLSASSTVTSFEIGYGDTAVSATTTAPTAAVLMASIPSPADDAVLPVSSILGAVPAGRIPWARHTPGVSWSAHAVGILRKVTD